MEEEYICDHSFKYDMSKDQKYLKNAIRHLEKMGCSNLEALLTEVKNSSSGYAEFKDEYGSHFKIKLGDHSYTIKYKGY